MVELSSGLPKTNPASGREEDLNPGPPDYKSSTLTTRSRRLLNSRCGAATEGNPHRGMTRFGRRSDFVLAYVDEYRVSGRGNQVLSASAELAFVGHFGDNLRQKTNKKKPSESVTPQL